jgi:post-segregation antitoxin (ccd killing protein)
MKTKDKIISIRVNSEVFIKLKAFGFNVSEICRQALNDKLKKIKKVS